MIPIPDRMKHLRTVRDIAVPYGVVIGNDGTPHFSINDERVRIQSIRRDLCAICGTKLFRGRWLVGGPLAAFHPDGAFVDPPMHHECSHYALCVCPYLAAPQYVREVGLTKVAAKRDTFPDKIIMVDTTMMPGRPFGDLFVALMTTSRLTVFQNFNVKPKPPYQTVEYWRRGQQIDAAEGAQIVADALRNYSRG